MEISPGPTQVQKQIPGPGGERNWHTKAHAHTKYLSILCSSESTQPKWHGQLLFHIYLAITRTVPLGGSCQYSECRAWKVCLIRRCVKQCCCGSPPGAAESFTAVSQSLDLRFTTSGVNWRDKPSSIQALTPLRYYCSLSHATWGANWASASKKSHTQASLKQCYCSQSIEMMHGNKSSQTTAGSLVRSCWMYLDDQFSLPKLKRWVLQSCEWNKMVKTTASGWALLNWTLAGFFSSQTGWFEHEESMGVLLSPCPAFTHIWNQSQCFGTSARWIMGGDGHIGNGVESSIFPNSNNELHPSTHYSKSEFDSQPDTHTHKNLCYAQHK